MLIVLTAFAIIVPAVVRRCVDEDAAVPSTTRPPELFNEDGEFTFAILGYNENGQNLFARLGKATQTSLTIGFAAVIIIVVIGVLVGSDRRLRRRLVRQPADALRRHHAQPAGAVRHPDDHRLLRAGKRVGRDHRHRVDGLDDGRAPRARRVPQPARGRLRPGRTRPRRQPAADHQPPHAAAGHGPDRRGRDARHRRLGRGRVGAQLPRASASAATAPAWARCSRTRSTTSLRAAQGRSIRGSS